jgi:alanine racemase
MRNIFSSRVQLAIQFSREEALRLGHDHIGTEHLLLALVKEKDGVAAQVLRRFGVTYRAIREEIENILRQSPSKKETSRQGSRLGFRRHFFGWANKDRLAPIIAGDDIGANITRYGLTQQATDMRGSNESLRPTVAEIKLGAIAANVRRICQRVQPAEVMAVVKADGYGHGAIPAALAAISAGASQLGVALLEEGLELRRAKIEAPILVFGGFFEKQIDGFIANNLQFTLYDLRFAQTVSRRAQALGRQAQVHVKIDTGMGRVGLLPNEAIEAIRAMAKLPNLELVGLYTHFASSDSGDKTYAYQQLKQFQSLVQQLAHYDLRFKYLHTANSGAILDLPQSYFNLVRPGVMVYGYYPSGETSQAISLQPAMTLRTEILFVKQTPAGAFISYGKTFQTDHPTTIATLPIGYADGISRRLSNNFEVLVRGRRCPLVGRVCMDQIMIDLGDMKDVKTGEEVVLLGKQGEEEISIYEWCRRLETIPYEVTCGISKRVARVYV